MSNPVVLTGDIHCFFTNDLKLDFENMASPTVATEFVGTSVTANAVPYDFFAKYLPDNPHMKFFESRKRGYVSVEVAADQMVTKYQAVSDVKDPAATVTTLKQFVVENGKAGATST